MKKAFTLAELMITLSILGIIISILIPVLDNSKPDPTVFNYKKSFYAIEEAVTYIVNNPDLYPSGDLLHPKNELNSSGDTSGRILCYNIANALNTVGTIKCPGSSSFINMQLINGDNSTGFDMLTSNVNFKLTNGAAIGGIHGSWSNINDDLTSSTAPMDDETEPNPLRQFITLCIDANGMTTTPNQGCHTSHRSLKNRDQFRIRISRDGRVYTGNSAGANNWFHENMMLVNPRILSISKVKLNAAQIANLTRPASSANKPDLSLESRSLLDYGYIWVIPVRRWVYTSGVVPSESNRAN